MALWLSVLIFLNGVVVGGALVLYLRDRSKEKWRQALPQNPVIWQRLRDGGCAGVCRYCLAVHEKPYA